jgi:hypothetical protein
MIGKRLENWTEIPMKSQSSGGILSDHYTIGGFDMKKSSLFISAILTTFMLAVLAGVVTAYRSFTGSTSQVVQPTAQVIQVPAPTATGIQPQEAAQIAANFLARHDLYSVETVQYRGASVYLVTFSSGDLVYVSMEGKVLNYIAPQTVQSVDPAQPVQVGSNSPVPPPFFPENDHEGGSDD